MNYFACRTIAVALACLLLESSPILPSSALIAAEPGKLTDPGTEGDGEFTIGPDYANAPELAVKDDVPKGTVHEFTMNSEDSKIYPGIAKNKPGVVPYKRKVWVYVPKQYVP